MPVVCLHALCPGKVCFTWGKYPTTCNGSTKTKSAPLQNFPRSPAQSTHHFELVIGSSEDAVCAGEPHTLQVIITSRRYEYTCVKRSGGVKHVKKGLWQVSEILPLCFCQPGKDVKAFCVTSPTSLSRMVCWLSASFRMPCVACSQA